MDMNYDFKNKAQEILDKKFKCTNKAGYDPVDVDTYFDEVIEYLKSINNIAVKMYDKKNNYETQINELKNELIEKNNTIVKLEEQNSFLKKEGYENVSSNFQQANDFDSSKKDEEKE